VRHQCQQRKPRRPSRPPLPSLDHTVMVVRDRPETGEPSTIAVRTVAAGRLGRKSGRGYYEYGEAGEHRPPDPEPLP
jgi:3-hydroxyacyl-CoA dehydrogenase